MEIDKFLLTIKKKEDESRLSILLGKDCIGQLLENSPKTTDSIIKLFRDSGNEIIDEKLRSWPKWQSPVTYGKVIRALHDGLSQVEVTNASKINPKCISETLKAMKALANSYNTEYQHDSRKKNTTSNVPENIGVNAAIGVNVANGVNGVIEDQGDNEDFEDDDLDEYGDEGEDSSISQRGSITQKVLNDYINLHHADLNVIKKLKTLVDNLKNKVRGLEATILARDAEIAYYRSSSRDRKYS